MKAFWIIFCLTNFQTSHAGIGPPEDASKTLFYKRTSLTSLGIWWSDKPINGNSFITYDTVKIFYQNVLDNNDVGNIIDVPRVDHGFLISNLNPSGVYYVEASYAGGAEPSPTKCFPVYVFMEDMGGRPAGVYDMLIKATPEQSWKHNGDSFKLLRGDSAFLKGMYSGFDGDGLISPHAFQNKYSNYIVAMRQNPTYDLNWLSLQLELKSLKDHFAESTSLYWGDTDNVLALYGENRPQAADYYTINIGFNQGYSSHKIEFGVLMVDCSMGCKTYAFGIGLSYPPYVGLYEPILNAPISFYGYILGQRSEMFITDTLSSCITPTCGYGTKVYDHVCDVPEQPWKDVFCPRKKNDTCIQKECPFGIPENLRVEVVDRYYIKVKWDSFDRSSLQKKDDFQYKLMARHEGNTIHTSLISHSEHSYIFSDLSSFTEYSIHISGYSLLGNVQGNYSEPVNQTTKQDVPNGIATITSMEAINSTCMLLQWQHIPEKNVRGILRGYQIKYHDDDFNVSKIVETGPVTEYLICGLLPFKQYEVHLWARNDDYLADLYASASNMTDEDVPLKFGKNVWGEDTGSYSIKVEWERLTNVREWLGHPYQYHVYYRRFGKSEFTEQIVVNASTFKVEIDGLEGYREYEVAVAAATTVGVGAYSDIEIIKTGEAPPTGPPQNVTGAYNNSRSIYVNWTELMEEDTRGIITKYLIICTTISSVEMGKQNISSSERLTTVFGGLQIYRPYLVTVAAYTAAGLGSFSDPLTVWTDAEAPFRGPYNLTGYNTSSTSIYIEWNDIHKREWAGVIGNFQLTIQSVDDPNDKNITNITRKGNEKMFIFEAKDLKYFTTYQIKVSCFNVKGVSPFSNITVTTEESWSVIFPPSIHAVATGSNNVSISWELPDETKIPGIVRGYTVRLQPIYTAEDLTIGTYSTRQRRDAPTELCAEGQYCEGLPMEMNNMTISSAGTVSFNTSGLRGNTFYNISISVDTKFVGLTSSPVQFLTPEGTPTMSAYNFTCEAVSYNALLLQWKHSPPAYLEGIRTKYMIYYQLGNKIVNETDEPYKRRMELFFLKANTQYTVWMTAFTSVGEGKPTEKLNCSTYETEPTAAPLHVRASSFHYPYASLIQWEHIPDDQWQGSKQGYTIFYEKLSTGEIDVDDGWIKATRVDVPLTTSYVLTGLESYSVYSVRIAARSNAGVGFKSESVRFETCHVPQAKLILNYMVYPPYVDYPKGNNLRPEGIVMDLTEQMLLTCAHNCTSFNQSVYVSYNRVDLDSFSDIKNFTVNRTALQVPRLDTGKFTPEYSLIATTTSPGFIILEVPDSPAQAATKVEDGLLSGIFGTLPICAFYFMLNWLFGAIFWFCEPTKVEHKGRGISLAGIFEGLYLAIMTSTTVGYGDKIPETTSGRIYIVFWTLLGLVLTGIVTGTLSSALSVAAMNSMKQKLPDDKVLALYGSAEYTYGKKNIKKFDKNKTYYSYEEVFGPLKNKSVKYALLDRYVAEVLKSNISDYGLGVNKAFNVPSDFGVAAFGEMEKLKVCGTKFAKANTDITSKAISNLLKELAQARAKAANGKNSSTSTSLPSTEENVDLISFQAPLYQNTLKILLIMWAVFIMLGIIYEGFRKRRANIEKNKIHTERERNLLWHTDLRIMALQTAKEFEEMMCRVEDKIEKLNYKHGKELLEIRTKMSKKFGVNFKYVKPSELGVSLEKILEYKEDLKNKPKEPFSVKFRRLRVSIASFFVKFFRFLMCK